MNSNNSTADSSTQATDDSSQPSPIRTLAITVKVEKGATATSYGHSGISSACTIHDPSIIGSTNENPITTLV